MSRTVTALYTTREEAECALVVLKQEVSLAHAEIYDRTPAGTSALNQLDLTSDERAACDRSLANGGYMLLAQVHGGEEPDHIIELLERIAQQQTGNSDFRLAPADAAAAPAPAPAQVDEERLPVIEEELRIGTREVARGGARVHSRIEEVPVQQDVELIEEHTIIERRPASRLLSEAELEQGGLLRERVIEIAQMREEAVVSKQAYVREEVLVKKRVERRVEQIHDTVRRTQIETETLQPEAQERSDFSG
jgi:uncharacterized protein (TIGR02271 family)